MARSRIGPHGFARHVDCSLSRKVSAASERSEAWIRTGCPYCGVGCGLTVGVAEGRVFRVKGDPAHPSSRGEVCMKAVCLPPTIANNGRAQHALVRANVGADFARSSTDSAIAFAAAGLRRIVSESGPDAIAFYGSGQLMTEDYYALTKLVKGFLGTDNLDTNSRLCMASAVQGYQRAFGALRAPNPAATSASVASAPDTERGPAVGSEKIGASSSMGSGGL